MKTLLVGINTKYIHTNIGIRSIFRYCTSKGLDIDMVEYTINEEFSKILTDIYSRKPDILMLSCYIWNVELVKTIADALKKANLNILIIVGGPEVWYDPYGFLAENNAVDIVAGGEGEELCFELITALYNKQAYKKIKGISYRLKDEIIINQPAPAFSDINLLPFLYTEQELNEKGKIFQYESSRGCPYACDFCLSCLEHKTVRFKDSTIVYKDMDRFIAADVKIVKFTDRTFNANIERACDILEYIAKRNNNTCFHFEVCAENINKRFVEAVALFKKGLIRLEIGMQSTNKQALEAVNRKNDFDKLSKNIYILKKLTHAIIHLDLISGLPYEDYTSFKASFNMAYLLNPDELQLGFLKLLKGTPLLKKADLYGYRFLSKAPYEIISNNVLSYDDIVCLKEVEEVLELYHNSGVFNFSLPLIIKRYALPFDFFKGLSLYFKKHSLLRLSHSRERLFDYLYGFCKRSKHDKLHILEAIIKDYLLACRGLALPDWARNEKEEDFAKKCRELLADNSPIIRLLPELFNSKVSVRHKQVRFEYALNKYWLVDYNDKKIIDVTQYFV